MLIGKQLCWSFFLIKLHTTVNIALLLRKPISKNIYERLLLRGVFCCFWVSFPVKRPSIKFKHFLGLFHENITSPNSFCGSVVFITKLVNLDVESIALYTLHRRLTVKMTNLMGNRDIACVFYVLVMVVNIIVNSDGS